MYFFAIIFIVLCVIFLKAYGKKDPITKDKVSHRRSFSKELCEPDEPFIMRTELENKASRSMKRVCLRHTLDEDFALVGKQNYTVAKNANKNVFICKTHVKAKATRVFETPVSISRRGAYQTHDLAMDYVDFLGFHASYYNKTSIERVVILPRRVNNKFMSKMIAQGYGDFNAKRGFIDDETTVRNYGEYTGHEPMRHINWKKSAQAGEFIVKQFEPMGTYVTTIVLDISGFTHAKKGSQAYELVEYSISMLREMFEYFEEKRIPYRLYTNAHSKWLHEHAFSSTSSGKKTRHKMLYMLGELNTSPEQSRTLKSKQLLDLAIKNSFRAPFAYVAPIKREVVNLELKKATKIKGVEIFEFYADEYWKQQEKE